MSLSRYIIQDSNKRENKMVKRETQIVSGVIPKELFNGLCRDGVANGMSVSKMVAQALEMYYKQGGYLAFMEMKMAELKQGKPDR